MSMKNTTLTKLLILIFGFSLVVLVVLAFPRGEKKMSSSTRGSGDAGEESKSLDGVKFTSLPVCRMGEEYCTGNEVLSMYGVEWGNTVVSFTIEIGGFDRVIKPLTLKFRTKDTEESVILPECFPGSRYRVTIPRSGTKFCLFDATWSEDLEGIKQGERKEFGGWLKKTGANTLRYNTLHKKTVYVLNKEFDVIDRLELKGYGKVCTRFGAKYYKEVIQ